MKLLNQSNFKKSTLFFIILVCVLSIPAIFSLFHGGFFQTDDGTWMVIRFSAFYEALRSGQFPVRFLPRLNFGYGYPVADFLYPLFMYIGLPIHVVGFGFVNTIKIIFGLSVVTSGIFCFYWLRKLFSLPAASIGALCYVFFPYHLWDMYKRGSVGEVLALAFVPFILWQIERKNIIFTSLGIGLLILSHNTLALFFLPIIVLYMFLTKKVSFLWIGISGAIGLGIAAFFWIPALFDKQFTVFDKTQISDIANYFIRGNNYLLFGIVTIIGMISIVYITRKKREPIQRLFLYAGIISIFFSLPISQVLWNVIPVKNLIQFPFRLLSIAMLSVSFSLALTYDYVKKFKKTLYIVLLFIIYTSAIGYLTPKVFQNYPDGYYTTNVDTTTVKNEYMPKWVSVIPSEQAKQKVVGNGIIVSNIVSKGTNIQFQVIANNAGSVLINQVFFPGWNVFIDNNPLVIAPSVQGFLEVSIPALGPTSRQVEVSFGETPIRLASDIITLVSLLSLGAVFFLNKKNEIS